MGLSPTALDETEELCMTNVHEDVVKTLGEKNNSEDTHTIMNVENVDITRSEQPENKSSESANFEDDNKREDILEHSKRDEPIKEVTSITMTHDETLKLKESEPLEEKTVITVTKDDTHKPENAKQVHEKTVKTLTKDDDHKQKEAKPGREEEVKTVTQDNTHKPKEEGPIQKHTVKTVTKDDTHRRNEAGP